MSAKEQKKILILGAGYNQLPAIKKASTLGYHVTTLDYLPDNVGHKHSDCSVSVSTAAKEDVLSTAMGLDVDGVLTYASDVAVPTAGYVSDNLGLPGCSFEVAVKMSNKGSFRAVQHESKIKHPQFVVSQEFDEINANLGSLSSDLVFKPVDASGSRGLSIVKLESVNQCKESFLYAQKYSRSGIVCVEEYIKGIDMSGDGFLVDGKLVLAFFTQKFTKNLLVTGHYLSVNITESERKHIIEEIEKNCMAVGYKNGPINFDILLADGQPVVIEMSPRPGGNGIPELIEHSVGIDLISMSIKYAMGDLNSIPSGSEEEKSCGSLIFGSECKGLVKCISLEKTIYELNSEIFNLTLKYKLGDDVEEFTHGGNSIGQALFDCSSPSHYEEVVDNVYKTLDLEVLP